jgi:hypothetical protein
MIHVPIPAPIEAVLSKVEHWPISEQIGGGKLFPTFESLHVLGVGILLGSLFMVDLRLLGVAARRYSVRRMSDELTPWTFGAFALAIVTGMLLVIVHPTYYASNPAFVAKMVLLVVAGANMLVFHNTIWRSVDGWGDGDEIPIQAKVAGGLSLLFWVGVIAMGRWIAFFL